MMIDDAAGLFYSKEDFCPGVGGESPGGWKEGGGAAPSFMPRCIVVP